MEFFVNFVRQIDMTMRNMTKILLLALLACVAFPTGTVAKKSGRAAIKFREYRLDLGTVREKGGPVSCEFVFTNAGDANLLILDAKASCGCTRPEYPQKPVAPGKSGKIKVTYNPLGRPGVIDRTVTVVTNGKPKKVRLHLGGNVVPGK